VVISKPGQVEKVLIQRGRKYLRDVLKDSDLLHHIGDVHITSHPEYIVGIAAWLPASAMLCEVAQLATRKEDLRRELVSHCGVKPEEARRLAADPIYVGEHFNEARLTSCDEEGRSAESVSDFDSDSEEQPSARPDAPIQQPSRRPLRKLRAKLASGKPLSFTADLDDDEDDAPLFPKDGSNPKPVAIPTSQGLWQEADSGSDTNPSRPLKSRRRGAVASAPAGGGVEATSVSVERDAAGDGDEAAGRKQGLARGCGEAKVPAAERDGTGLAVAAGLGRGRARRGRGRGAMGSDSGSDAGRAPAGGGVATGLAMVGRSTAAPRR
jgi:hypothetical protein